MLQSLRTPAAMACCLMCTMFWIKAGDAGQDRSNLDLEAMQGTWVGRKWMNAGVSAPPNQVGQVGQLVLTIRGDQTILRAATSVAATITLDATKSPPTADFTDSSDGKVDRGIYRLDRDTLTFCLAVADSGKDRPKAFESTNDNGFMLIVLQRQAHDWMDCTLGTSVGK